MRSSGKVFLASLLFLLGAATLVSAGVPKVIFVEEFGYAT